MTTNQPSSSTTPMPMIAAYWRTYPVSPLRTSLAVAAHDRPPCR